MNLTDLLEKLTRLSASFSQQGTAFERMMRTYLQTDPLYPDRFEKVFSWMEWPDRPTRGNATQESISLGSNAMAVCVRFSANSSPPAKASQSLQSAASCLPRRESPSPHRKFDRPPGLC